MAPKTTQDKKRKKSASGKSSRQLIAATFRLFMNIALMKSPGKKRIIPEKGIAVCGGEYPEITEMISRRGWKTLVFFPKEAYEDIVKKFYANAYNVEDDDDNYTSFVQGKVIHFNGKAISDLLHAPYADDCAFVKSKIADVDFDELFTALVQPGADWVRNKMAL